MSVYPLQKRKNEPAISIHFLQQHNLFLKAIINLPENLAPSQLMRLGSIKTQWSFLLYISISFTLQ